MYVYRALDHACGFAHVRWSAVLDVITHAEDMCEVECGVICDHTCGRQVSICSSLGWHARVYSIQWCFKHVCVDDAR